MRESWSYAGITFGLFTIHVSLFTIAAAGFVLVALGLIVWTLFEYAMHRSLHDWKPIRKAHLAHHKAPLADSIPSAQAVVGIFLGLFALFYLAVGSYFATSFGAGFTLGYSIYIYTHWALHHVEIGEAHRLRPLYAHHSKHHRGVRGRFGVTTTFWDNLFNRG